MYDPNDAALVKAEEEVKKLSAAAVVIVGEESVCSNHLSVRIPTTASSVTTRKNFDCSGPVQLRNQYYSHPDKSSSHRRR